MSKHKLGTHLDEKKGLRQAQTDIRFFSLVLGEFIKISKITTSEVLAIYTSIPPKGEIVVVVVEGKK
ncbi:hypothetical protein [Polaribacter sp.]|uniref:hypothetical protein n=1 Tax=Polaribacter sp. TaxID=1920175 RepID=UPI003EF95A6D